MEIGLFHSVQWPEGSSQRDRYDQALRQAEFTEELGFDSVWVTEHHFSRHGIVSDSLAVLAYLAARTNRIRLGTAVSVLPLHDPVRVAETAATVDLLSGGRLDFGVGRGYQPGEFTGFGQDISDKGSRFDEAMDVILRCWTGPQPFTHNGRHWQYWDTSPQPRPLQDPHPPIWVATDSTEGLTRCAQNDWGVLLPQGRSLSTVAEQMEAYTTALRAAGKSAESAKVFLARAAYVSHSDDRAWEEVEGPYRHFLALASQLGAPRDPTKKVTGAEGPFAADAPLRDSVVFGNPDSCLASLRKIRDLGIERVMLFSHMGELPHEQIMQSLELFGREVLPAAREL